MKISPAAFEQRLRDAGAVECGRVHSEFSQDSPLHGQKVDMDRIPTDDPLFETWVDATAEHISTTYGDKLPEVVVGVANGMNRVVYRVAKELGVLGLQTVKVRPGVAILEPDKLVDLMELEPEFALILDDVGSTGRTTASVASTVIWARVPRVEVLYTWQRTPELPRLIEIGVAHRAIINTPLPTFTPEECASLPEGFCANDYRLNSYPK